MKKTQSEINNKQKNTMCQIKKIHIDVAIERTRQVKKAAANPM